MREIATGKRVIPLVLQTTNMKVKNEKMMNCFACIISAMLAITLAGCHSDATEAEEAVSSQSTNIEHVKRVDAVCSQRIQEPLKKNVWIETPEGNVTVLMVQKALKEYGLKKGASLKTSDYIFSAKIDTMAKYGRRVAIAYTVTMKKNVPSKDIIWTGTATCDASAKINTVELTPSMFACLMTKFNKNYDGLIPFFASRSMFNTITGK